MSRRASPRNWCDAGLRLLRDDGIGAVTIDQLCAAMQKTKGSFYHHFRDIDSYMAALLLRWEESQTEEPIQAAGEEPDPLRRAARLVSAVLGLDHPLDAAVRAWALRNPQARAAIDRVDNRRISYLARLYRMGGYRQPRMLAELEYMAFVGGQQLGIFATPIRAARLGRALRKALVQLGVGKVGGAPFPAQ